jgi:hypothetical protein
MVNTRELKSAIGGGGGKGVRLARASTVLGVCFWLSACADQNTPVEPSGRVGPPPSAQIGWLGIQGQSAFLLESDAIIISDDDGTKFAFDWNTKSVVILSSAGNPAVRIPVPSTDLADVANLFIAMSELDSLSSIVRSMPFNGGEWQQQSNPLGLEQPINSAARLELTVDLPAVNSSSRIRFRRTGQMSAGGNRYSPTPLYLGEDPCNGIRRGIAQRHFDWQSKRGTKLDDLRAVATNIADLEWDYASATWTVKPANIGTVALELLTNGLAIVSGNIESRISAVLYNSYGCGGQPIFAGPYGGFGGMGGGEFGVYSCNNELWEISFDGGVTWHPVTIQNCGIRKATN